MSEPISRRSAILRAIAAFTTAKLVAWEAPRGRKLRWSDQPLTIVPGERFGEIFIGMRGSDVTSLLGQPCTTNHFAAEKLEDTLQVFEYINRTTGRNLTAKDAFPLRKASTYFNYDRTGLSVCLKDARVSGIIAFTGVQSGYEKISRFAPADHILSGASLLRTLSDVQSQLGKPDGIITSEYAPIPDATLIFRRGITFSGRADDDRLATITVMAPKQDRTV